MLHYANQGLRHNAIHLLTNTLAKKYNVLVIEDLNAAGMMGGKAQFQGQHSAPESPASTAPCRQPRPDRPQQYLWKISQESASDIIETHQGQGVAE